MVSEPCREKARARGREREGESEGHTHTHNHTPIHPYTHAPTRTRARVRAPGVTRSPCQLAKALRGHDMNHQVVQLLRGHGCSGDAPPPPLPVS